MKHTKPLFLAVFLIVSVVSSACRKQSAETKSIKITETAPVNKEPEVTSPKRVRTRYLYLNTRFEQQNLAAIKDKDFQASLNSYDKRIPIGSDYDAYYVSSGDFPQLGIADSQGELGLLLIYDSDSTAWLALADYQDFLSGTHLYSLSFSTTDTSIILTETRKDCKEDSSVHFATHSQLMIKNKWEICSHTYPPLLNTSHAAPCLSPTDSVRLDSSSIWKDKNTHPLPPIADIRYVYTGTLAEQELRDFLLDRRFFERLKFYREKIETPGPLDIYKIHYSTTYDSTLKDIPLDLSMVILNFYDPQSQTANFIIGQYNFLLEEMMTLSYYLRSTDSLFLYEGMVLSAEEEFYSDEQQDPHHVITICPEGEISTSTIF